MVTEVAGMMQTENIPLESSIICTQNMWKTYATDSGQQVHALCGVDLTIHRNEYVAIRVLRGPASPR